MNGLPVAEAEFRQLMARWATGVSVVTSRAGARDVGLTVNAFLSVALEPPTVLISLQEAADTTGAVVASGVFAVNLLAYDQRAISERFARTGPAEEKFRDLPLARGATGAALLPDGLGSLEARVRSVVPVADHRLIVGGVVALRPGREVPPLVFFRSRYAASDGRATVELPPPAEPPKR
jgi:flavin reductase (DIM6/NTAB) family NADH-FMN oxidoreductase RutF